VIEVVCEFLVKEEARGQFELAYGPGGAWSNLFAKCPGFRGTTLMRDTKDPRRYLTVDLWESEDQRSQMLADNKDEYADLESAFAEWTESKTELGAFRVLAEATVYPRGRGKRSKFGGSRRGSHQRRS
jgi:hypothetical protein